MSSERSESIPRDAPRFDADPERVELMAATLAEMIVLIMALLVVEADPDFFHVLGELDLQRLTRRQALGRAGGFGLEEQREGVCRLGGKRVGRFFLHRQAG